MVEKKHAKIKIEGLGFLCFINEFLKKKTIINRYKVFKKKEEDTFFWFDFLKKKHIDLVIDIGCNVGVYTLLSAKLFPKANILAIDASNSNCDVTLKMLENNFKKKFQERKFSVQQAFLGSKKPVLVNIGGHSNLAGETIGTDKDRSGRSNEFYQLINYPFKIFGNFANLFNQKIKNSIMKIDIDGGELDMLRGISKEQFKEIISIAVEVDLFDKKKIKKILEFLGRNGFYSSKSNTKILKFYQQCLPKKNSENYNSVDNLINLFNNSKMTTFEDNIFDKCKNLNFFQKRLIRKKNFNITKDIILKKRFAVNLFFYKD